MYYNFTLKNARAFSSPLGAGDVGWHNEMNGFELPYHVLIMLEYNIGLMNEYTAKEFPLICSYIIKT